MKKSLIKIKAFFIFYNRGDIMANTCGCNNTANTCNTSNKKNTCGGGFAFILVLFILIILVGAAWVN